MTDRALVALPLLLAVLGFSGCAYNSQTVRLAPAALIAPSDRGQGIAVAVRVIDERPSQSLGKRGDAYGNGAQITSTDDIARLVADEIKRGLAAKNFSLSETAGTSLLAEVRLLEYSTSVGVFTGGVHIRAAIKVRAASSSGKTHEKLYRSDHEERVAVVPTAEKNEAWINRGLSEVIEQIFTDEQLLDLLAGR
jgi:uncharacterized lipoprotein